MVVEESKEADKTTGEATHRISRGINDKVIDYTVDVLLHHFLVPPRFSFR